MFTFARIKEVNVLCYVSSPQYAFVEEVDGELYVFPCLKSRTYNPLSNFLVLTDFLSIGTVDDEEEAARRAVEFVSKWGALGHALYGISYPQMAVAVLSDEVEPPIEPVYGKPCRSLVSETPFKTAGIILNYTGVAVRKNAQERGIILRKDSPFYAAPLYRFAGSPAEVATLLDDVLEKIKFVDTQGEVYIFMGENVQEIAERSRILMEALEHYSSPQDIKSHLVISQTLSWITKGAEFKLADFSKDIEFRINSLWSAICFMLLKLLHDGKIDLSVCPHCKRVFIPSRSNQRFCSSSCRNRYAAKLSYQRRKQKEPGED